jgi:hypothetical protein
LTHFFFDTSTILEELSVRSNLALAQKKVMNDLEDEDFELEYVGLCAQVVSSSSPKADSG